MGAPTFPQCAGHPECNKGQAHYLRKNPKQKVLFQHCTEAHAIASIKKIWRDTANLASVPQPSPWINPSFTPRVCYASKGGHVLLAAPCKLPTIPEEDIVLCNAAYQKPGFTTHYACKRGGAAMSNASIGEKRSPPQVRHSPPQVVQFAFRALVKHCIGL